MPSAPVSPRLLLLSNSTNYGAGFLEHATGTIKDFLGSSITEVLFVPFAGVRIDWNAFTEKVRDRLGPLGYKVTSVHSARDPAGAVRGAAAIAVGGGNTFHLLETMAHRGLLSPIRERVRAGVPFVGWSAGANVACPTIRTTNDMPIVEPPSLDAFGFLPFQINPHYTDARMPDHSGETRAERLLEFVEVNPDVPVLGLREGSILRVEGATMTLLGDQPARLFRQGRDPEDVAPGVLPQGWIAPPAKGAGPAGG
jgi:dipeptidase E